MEDKLTIDGINVCYDVVGEGEPVLLIHGLGVGKHIWSQLTAEASKLFTIYAPDLPGFGCSDAPDLPYGVSFYVAFLEKFMDSLGLERAALVGSSMGGRIAVAFAAKYPERVSRLVLLAPGGLTPLHTRFSYSTWLMDANFWLMSQNQGIYRKSYDESFFDTAKIPDWLVEEGWASLKRPDYRRAFLRNAQLLAHPDHEFKAVLGSVKAKTLVIWGSQDKVVPVSDAEIFAELIKDSEVRVLDKCGHMILLECGEQCSDLITSFLGEEDLYYTDEELSATKK